MVFSLIARRIGEDKRTGVQIENVSRCGMVGVFVPGDSTVGRRDRAVSNVEPLNDTIRLSTIGDRPNLKRRLFVEILVVAKRQTRRNSKFVADEEDVLRDFPLGDAR